MASAAGMTRKPVGEPTSSPSAVASHKPMKREIGGISPGGKQVTSTSRGKGIGVSSIGGSDGGNEVTGEYCEGNLQIVFVIDTGSDVMCVRFDPSGSLIAAGLADGSVKIYSADSGKCLHSLVVEARSITRMPVTSVRFLPSSSSSAPSSPTDGDNSYDPRANLLIATYTTGHLRLWHYTSGTCMHTTNELRKSGQTLSSAFSPSGDRIVTVGADPQIFLYDVATNKRVNSLDATPYNGARLDDSKDKMDGHRCRVFTVQYSPSEPNIFLTGGWDNTVQFWDDRSKHSFRRFFGPHICGDALDIDPDTGDILTGSWRKESALQIWDFDSGDKIRDVPDDLVNPSQLYSAQWLGKDNIVCGGSGKNMARVIDKATLNSTGMLVELSQGVYCIDNDHQGSHPSLIVGASTKVYYLRVLPPQPRSNP